MFHILGFLFLIIIAILLIGLSIIGTVIRSIFGFGGRRPRSNYNQGGGNYRPQDNSYDDRQSASSRNHAGPTESDTSSRRKKLFSEDEGEYVDFEEIKE